MASPTMDLESLVVKLVGDASDFDAVMEATQKKIDKAANSIKKAAQQAEAYTKAMFREGTRLNKEMMTPLENYRMELARLDEMLKAGAIFTETYDRKLRELKKTLPVNAAAEQALADATQQANEAQAKMNASLKRGNTILASFTPDMGKYAVAVHKLNMHLRAGRITNEGYEKSLGKIAAAARDAAARQQALQSKVASITRAHYTPEQNHTANIKELNTLRAAGLARALYIKLVKEENIALANNRQALKMAGLTQATAAEAQKLHNEYTARANQLIEQGTSKYTRYKRDLTDLKQLYHANYINAHQYNIALKALNAQNQFFLQHLNKIAFQLRVVSSGFSRFGAGLRSIGTMGSLFITAPLTAFAAAGVHELMTFDEAMTKSLSIADNVTPQLRRQMELVAITLSEKAAHSATELAQAYYELISAGLDAKTSMMSLATVSKFATAGDMELASSVKHLAKATAAMGLAGKNAQETSAGMYRVANVLVQAANMTTGSIADMTQALVNGAAPQAKILNMQLEDTVAILMHYIQVGESAAESSEHFAIGMRLLGTAYAEHKDFWKQQGLSLYTATGQMRKFTDVLHDMQSIYFKLSSEGKVPFLKALGFQALQQRALNPLLADPEAVKQIDEWSQKLQRAGALEEVAAKQMQSLSNQFKVFRNTVLNVAREVGLMLLPYLQKGISIVKLMINYWKGMSDAGKRAVAIIAALVAGIGPLIAAFGTMVTLAAAVAGGISAVLTAIVAVGFPIAAVAAGFAILASAMAAVGAYSIAMQQWPGETKKVLTILERMWHAFEGFMYSVFDKIFTVDMLKAATLGLTKLLLYVTIPFGGLIKRSLMGEDVSKEATKYSEKTMKEIQAAFDTFQGSIDLGGTLSRIIKEELGEFNLGDKLKEQMGLDELESNISEAMKNAASRIKELSQGAGGFSGLTEKINELNDRFKEMLALEEAQAKVGYDKVNKMTTAEKELFKLEMEIAKERQAITDRFDQEEGVRAEIDARKQQALRTYDAEHMAILQEVRDRTALISQYQRQAQRQQELQAIIDRDPAKKFGKQMKDLGDAYATGEMSARHYRKELQELRSQMLKEYKVDFKVGGTAALRHGASETRAALENFLMMQKEALKPIHTPEQLMAEHTQPPVPIPKPLAGAEPLIMGHEGAIPGNERFKETKRLLDLTTKGGVLGAEARRKVANLTSNYRIMFKARRQSRLEALAQQGGNVGYHARRQLMQSFGRTAESFTQNEAQRLQGLVEKGGRIGHYARQELKKMGITPGAEGTTVKEGSSPASRRVEETKAQQSQLGILKSMDKHLATIAKKKSVEIEPANLT